MAKKESNRVSTDLITLQPADSISVLPPNSGIVGTFLEQTANMFKAREMRMNGLLRRIDEAGQRTESLLRTAAERMEAAEAALQEQFNREGLVQLNDSESENNS
ncbi:hypothetical protein [Desulfomonile tiedjei]|uniref:Uncharacterized protein n=1 Tax=Desulfomonile tiedjei (strain ATCC 49306 / DSM 6799 / DCB-1) TaxID=706587 RepID=I4C176_DESTA|nr:hypothetical protein [Desulfomonile tiedjei]AFM23317.1 hypothetical protein Desti_0586 [Desulfomonile tiedjei DSM 6799]